jgi:hypothetical protein
VNKTDLKFETKMEMKKIKHFFLYTYQVQKIEININSVPAKGICSVSPDRNRIFVINDTSRKEEPGISIAYKNGNTW